MIEPLKNEPATHTSLAEEQRQRLVRWRKLVCKSSALAARELDITKDQWNRMENGKHRINTVYLNLFARRFNLPTEYVVSGGYSGLRSDQVEILVQMAHEEAASVAVAASARAVPARSLVPQDD